MKHFNHIKPEHQYNFFVSDQKIANVIYYQGHGEFTPTCIVSKYIRYKMILLEPDITHEITLEVDMSQWSKKGAALQLQCSW